MENETIQQIQPTPKLTTTRCKLLEKTLTLALNSATFAVALTSYILYDWFVAFFTLVFSFLLTGIVRSKLRVLAIPSQQQERNYKDKELIAWYLFLYVCYENKENKENFPRV